ncbi:hypothetical protein BTM25_11890 [Actinomadura rubteroloni]|uniref:Uncharacterized protein n=1 Tax=Actinomadura rubteroloni TaxID=1926885 RepID=A0A2P4UP11_9ACTN|nr:hypothetical protein [Actinomadura rubteroloni]POM26781.1 hypothetical protein BTM25_11890 [Actinomadura rubteroloni]
MSPRFFASPLTTAVAHPVFAPGTEPVPSDRPPSRTALIAAAFVTLIFDLLCAGFALLCAALAASDLNGDGGADAHGYSVGFRLVAVFSAAVGVLPLFATAPSRVSRQTTLCAIAVLAPISGFALIMAVGSL